MLRRPQSLFNRATTSREVTLTNHSRARHARAMQRFSFLLIGWAVVLAACAGPAAQTTATSAKPPGPDCSACLLENPGDARPCVAICHRPESDIGGAAAGGVIR